MRRILLLLSLWPWAVQADTLYLCKAYSGGMFWSSVSCSQKGATIDRMVTVPDGMPWEQQVQIGEQVRADAAALAAPPEPTPTQPPRKDKASTCKALEARIAKLDAMARQPQSGRTQDWITQQKRQARDRQFGLKC